MANRNLKPQMHFLKKCIHIRILQNIFNAENLCSGHKECWFCSNPADCFYKKECCVQTLLKSWMKGKSVIEKLKFEVNFIQEFEGDSETVECGWSQWYKVFQIHWFLFHLEISVLLHRVLSEVRDNLGSPIIWWCWLVHYFQIKHPSIVYAAYPCRAEEGLVPTSSCHWVRGGLHFGQIANPSQINIDSYRTKTLLAYLL